MKPKTSTTKHSKKRNGAPAGVTELIPAPTKALAEPFRVEQDPGARGSHGSPGRGEIRKTTHRVMGSRQSQRPIERHDEPRKKRG